MKMTPIWQKGFDECSKQFARELAVKRQEAWDSFNKAEGDREYLLGFYQGLLDIEESL